MGLYVSWMIIQIWNTAFLSISRKNYLMPCALCYLPDSHIMAKTSALIGSHSTQCAPTRRARGRLDSHRQIGFFRGFGFCPFRERVSSLQPPVTRAVSQHEGFEKGVLQVVLSAKSSIANLACHLVLPATS
jgi:hypothetical protein